ncbi:MAG: NAD-dependent dehydratase [Candidatus Taylorbacteria bacterium]|nr:NAD-dependent dehydratase [Candidatus Taylorbacteria bacterium]
MKPKNQYGNLQNLGYLIWAKIPFKYLEDSQLGQFLERDLSRESSAYLRKLHLLKTEVLSTVDELKARDIARIRTGASWSEWDMPQGKTWITWYLSLFAKNFQVLPNVSFTSYKQTDTGETNIPPRVLASCAAFTHEVIRIAGNDFDEIEIWNEYNLVTDWKHDPGYRKFIPMATMAAMVARNHGKLAVLGGVSSVKPARLAVIEQFARTGMLQYFDVIGFHNLRGTWSDNTPPPSLQEQAASVRKAASVPADPEALKLLQAEMIELASGYEEVQQIVRQEIDRQRTGEISVWLTEYGFPPIDPMKDYSQEHLEDIQVALFAHSVDLLLKGEIERIYWFTLRDDSRWPSLRQKTTGWEDILQYYYGDIREDGSLKLLGRLLIEGGPLKVLEYARSRNLWHLIDGASLARRMPSDYVSQQVT